MVDGLLNVRQVAIQLGLKDRTIRQWIALRKIEYVKAGTAVRIRQAEIDRIIRSGTVLRHRFKPSLGRGDGGPATREGGER